MRLSDLFFQSDYPEADQRPALRSWGAFDGIHVGYLAPIKENAPADYQKILDWFPFVEAETWRHEKGRFAMTWRELVGWDLLAAGSACGIRPLRSRAARSKP